MSAARLERELQRLLSQQLRHEVTTLLWGVCIGLLASLPLAVFIVRWWP